MATTRNETEIQTTGQRIARAIGTVLGLVLGAAIGVLLFWIVNGNYALGVGVGLIFFGIPLASGLGKRLARWAH